MYTAKNIIKELLKLAEIEIGGGRFWDIKVKNEQFYKRVLAQGSLGLGEAYMDEWWEAERLDEFFYRLLRAGLDKKVRKNFRLIMWVLLSVLLNRQSRSRAFNIGEKHYDIGNDLYKVMLDKRMVYTCGYWKGAKNLDEAQENKLDLICRKLDFKKGMKVLDIGSGWGSFGKFAAEKYGVSVVGVTVSKEQKKLADELCRGLAVENRLEDYRQVNEKFDRIVSLGMIEHVGYKNYQTYMKVVDRCLKEDGLFLLHTIAGNKSVTAGDAWTDKYIFPDGMLPSIKQLGKATEGLLVMEDWHNFGPDYDKTLMAWYNNFSRGWESIKDNYSPRFYKMWKYFLLSCAGSFRARNNQLWQIVFSKKGIVGGYNSIR